LPGGDPKLGAQTANMDVDRPRFHQPLVRPRDRMMRQTSSPLTTGRFKSRMTRSGGRLATARSASSPAATISRPRRRRVSKLLIVG